MTYGGHGPMKAKGHSRRGYTLIELLSAVALLSISMVGVSKIYQSHNHVYVRQDSRAELEENLRLGLAIVTDTLRNGKYGVPGNVTDWITWVPGFTGNPTIVDGGPSPDSISIASASAQPVATLTAAAAQNDTTLSVDTTADLNAGSKSLILIDDSESALITSVSGGAITIDTDPTSTGAKGLARGYPKATPIYRIDVITFTIATGANGVPELFRDDNHGGGAQVALEGISDLQITTVTAGKLYQVALTARTVSPDPVSSQYVTRTLQSNVAVVN